MRLYPRSLLLAAILTLIVVISYSARERERNQRLLTLADLCENEGRWFEELADRCRERAAEHIPWESDSEEDRVLKTQFWVGDPPTPPNWANQAAYLDRCSRRSLHAARRHAGW